MVSQRSIEGLKEPTHLSIREGYKCWCCVLSPPPDPLQREPGLEGTTSPIAARLSHKLPMNPRKVADKSLEKLPKSCYFFQKVAEKLLNFQKVAEKLPKFFCFSYLFWVLKIKNSHIASYQNFICQSPMIVSEVLSISLDQQIVYQVCFISRPPL